MNTDDDSRLRSTSEIRNYKIQNDIEKEFHILAKAMQLEIKPNSF